MQGRRHGLEAWEARGVRARRSGRCCPTWREGSWVGMPGPARGGAHLVRPQRRHLLSQRAPAVVVGAKGVAHHRHVGGQVAACGGGAWQGVARESSRREVSPAPLLARLPAVQPLLRLLPLSQARKAAIRTLVACLCELGRWEAGQGAPRPLAEAHQHGHPRLVAQRHELAKGGLMDSCSRRRPGRGGLRAGRNARNARPAPPAAMPAAMCHRRAAAAIQAHCAHSQASGTPMSP